VLLWGQCMATREHTKDGKEVRILQDIRCRKLVSESKEQSTTFASACWTSGPSSWWTLDYFHVFPVKEEVIVPVCGES
jgi:hypothetical protein